METCILVPRELSIVLKALPSPPSPPQDSPRQKAAHSLLLPASAAADGSRKSRWQLLKTKKGKSRPRLNLLPQKHHGVETPNDLHEDDLETVDPRVPSPTSSPEGRERAEPRVLRPVPVYSPLEMGATVWANVPLFPGQVFHPDQGEIRLDRLEIYSKLPSYDVSTCSSLLRFWFFFFQFK